MESNFNAAATAISAEKFFTFGAGPGAGYRVSFTQIDRLDYRRSNTGPAEGLLQYQVGAGAFNDVGPLSFSSSASGGESLGPILLSSISELQNVAGETPVTFRIVPFGATGATGTFYIFDRANTTAADLSLKGLVSPTGGTPPAITTFSPDNGGAGTVVTIDGTSFTAQPAADDINWVMDPENASPLRGSTVPMSTSASADGDELTVTTAEPAPFLLSRIGALRLPCAATLEDPASIRSSSNGTGLFKVTEVVPNDHICRFTNTTSQARAVKIIRCAKQRQIQNSQ